MVVGGNGGNVMVMVVMVMMTMMLMMMMMTQRRALQLKTTEYEILLSYPDWYSPNTIDLVRNGRLEQLSDGLADVPDDLPRELKEEILSDPRNRVWWLSFVKPGQVRPSHCHPSSS